MPVDFQSSSLFLYIYILFVVTEMVDHTFSAFSFDKQLSKKHLRYIAPCGSVLSQSI